MLQKAWVFVVWFFFAFVSSQLFPLLMDWLISWLGHVESTQWHLTGWWGRGLDCSWFDSSFLTSWIQMELLKMDSYFRHLREFTYLKKMNTKALSNENNHPFVCLKIKVLNLKFSEVRDIVPCGKCCSWESCGVTMTLDHGKITITSLKFSFFTWKIGLQICVELIAG